MLIVVYGGSNSGDRDVHGDSDGGDSDVTVVTQILVRR